MKAHPVPKVGDIVVLNDFGLRQIFNNTLGLSHMKTLRMKITHVDSESMTFPETTYCVDVDNEEINAYLIDHLCFDIVGSISLANFAKGLSYEEWRGQLGRGGIQRTLDRNDAVDAAFLSDAVSIVDDKGNERPMTFDEADRMGVRVIVSARKLLPEGDWS
jgi:hypothetical protein